MKKGKIVIPPIKKWPRHNFEFKDAMGETRTAVHVGKCIYCSNPVYGVMDKGEKNVQDPDPRGSIGPKRSCKTLVASEYGMSGPDQIACWNCMDTRITYETCLKIAEAQWTKGINGKAPHSPQEMDRAGALLADRLQLRKDTEHKNRWQTDWGTKTNTGIYLTLREMLRRIESGEMDSV